MQHSRHNPERGFSMLEVMVAIVVLSVGMMALAALMSKTTQATDRSRYMSIASMLASEKLEDLNRYPSSDPAVKIVSGTTAGSITSDAAPATIDGNTIAYNDRVLISSGDGGVTETIRSDDATGTNYTITRHKQDGTIAVDHSTTPPANSADTMVFTRRWLIEQDQPVTGVRRVTVLVSLITPVGPNVDFQMSMVRP